MSKRFPVSSLLPVAVLLLLLLVPWLSIHVPVVFNGPLNTPGNLQLLAVGFTLGIAALSYNLLFGYTGVLSFGHALFFGAGVYLPAIALRHWEWTVGPSLLFGLAGGILLAVAVGALSLRTHGVYFAMVTLAFAQAGAVIVGKNVGDLTGGEEGLSLRTRGLPDWMVGVVNTDKLYWLALSMLIVVYLLAWRLTTSPMGQIWKGIRENEQRIEMLGVRPYVFKLLAFVISSSLATLGGTIYLFLASGATPRVVSANFTVTLLLMVIIGGSGSLWGPIAGALLYHYLDVRLTDWAASDVVADLPVVLSRPLRDPLFIFGTIFILLVMFFPRGLAGAFGGRSRPFRHVLGGAVARSVTAHGKGPE
ncbi:MAG TPA: branched-chain amino acid ABC transporter permease [Thermomicrobiales bacterium]|nr:branched-chain amino acid ABC transporter permease [Thermomicrobiales bacterium]